MARAQQRIAELFADRPDVRQIMVSADRASSSITPNPNFRAAQTQARTLPIISSSPRTV